MAFCRSLISLLVLCVVSSSLAVEVPVFLWGDVGRNTKHNALSSVPEQEFRKILKHELLEDPFTVVFIEETLSVEDFSRKIDEHTSFPYLESEVGNSVYLPLVKDPLNVLNELGDSSQADHVKLTDNGLSADVSGEDGKFLFIHLKDAKEGESREDLLRRHNDFMEDMFNKLQERYNKVVAIYTAHNPSWTVVEHSRVRRQTEAKPKDSTANPAVTTLSFNGLKMYFQNATLAKGSGNATELKEAVGSSDSYVNTTEMNSTITFSGDVKVVFHFTTRGGYWFLNSASLTSPGSNEQTLYPADAEYQLFGYTGFSYRCSGDIRLQTIEPKPVNGTETNAQHWTLTFHNSRIQPFFVDNSTLEFGDMLNCTGFFTAPIWAGLFITFVMLAITFYGIMMMMDIKTMDRFDDPKGKTITINAAE